MQDRENSPVKDQRSTTVPRNQPKSVGVFQADALQRVFSTTLAAQVKKWWNSPSSWCFSTLVMATSIGHLQHVNPLRAATLYFSSFFSGQRQYYQCSLVTELLNCLRYICGTCKVLQQHTIPAIRGLANFGFRGSPGGLPPRDLRFWKALVVLMLSCNWHVTLRLTVFEIFAVKWPKFSPNISDLGRPWGHCPQNEKDLSETHVYHHTKFHADRCHRLRDICNRTETKTANLVPCHTNVWR